MYVRQDAVQIEGGLVVISLLGFFARMVGMYHKCDENLLLDGTVQKQPQT